MKVYDRPRARFLSPWREYVCEVLLRLLSDAYADWVDAAEFRRYTD